MNEYIEEFNELVNSIPMDEMNPLDQLAIMGGGWN